MAHHFWPNAFVRCKSGSKLAVSCANQTTYQVSFTARAVPEDRSEGKAKGTEQNLHNSLSLAKAHAVAITQMGHH